MDVRVGIQTVGNTGTCGGPGGTIRVIDLGEGRRDKGTKTRLGLEDRTKTRD